jgi:hypothetical protein
VESPIQSRRKGWFLFTSVNEIGRPCDVELMSSFLEALGSARLREVLSRKDEYRISSFVPQRHSV